MENKENAVAVRQEKTALIDQETIDKFLYQSNINLNEKQKGLFLRLAEEFQLNPFRREIYAIPYKDEFNIVTGYQVYLQRADATGKLDGWHCDPLYDKDGKLTGAKIVIHRKDYKQPFEWSASLRDFMKTRYDQETKKHIPTRQWAVMPEFMIKKVTIGQGFRLAFPNELGGMPYLEEELPSSSPEKPQERKPETPQSNPQQDNRKKPQPSVRNAEVVQLNEKEPTFTLPKEEIKMNLEMMNSFALNVDKVLVANWVSKNIHNQLESERIQQMIRKEIWNRVKPLLDDNRIEFMTVKSISQKYAPKYDELTYDQAIRFYHDIMQEVSRKPEPDPFEGTDFNPEPVTPPEF